MTTPDAVTPQEALAAVRRSRAAVAGQLRYPLSYQAGYALGAGGVVASTALPFPLGTIVCGLLAVLFSLMHRRWTEQSGLSVTGLSRTRARWIMIALGVVLMTLACTGLILHERVVWWAPLPLVPFAVLAAAVGSRLWLRAYRAELGARA